MSAVPVGRRNLFSERRRAVLGIAGVAVALLLILALDAIFAGMMKQVTAYIDTSRADVFVSQKGVRNMHMTSSAFPAAKVARIRDLRAVKRADPILLESDTIDGPDGIEGTYVVGYVHGRLGGPTKIVDGEPPGPGEMVVDEQGAEATGAGIGEQVRTLGTSWRVSGLTSGVSNLANTVAYVRFADFAKARRLPATVSYVLVQTDDVPGVIAAVERMGEMTAISRADFHAEERRLVTDMSTDLVRIMTFVAFLIGLVVIGLTLYAATLSRLREVGVMKAIGATWVRLGKTVLSQAMWTVASAVVLALVLVFAVGWLVSSINSNILLVVEWPSFLRVALGAGVLGALGALFPLVKVARVDPASVFRR